jgi:hypothetical protein
VPVSAAASHAISDTQRFGYASLLMVWMAGYAERSLRTKNHADLAIENRSKECELSQLDADADGEQRKEILTWGGPISISAPAKPMPGKGDDALVVGLNAALHTGLSWPLGVAGGFWPTLTSGERPPCRVGPLRRKH